MEHDPRWSLDSRFSLRFCAWDNEDLGIVYNKTSGKTHLVGVLGISILACLEDAGSVTESSILSSILPESDQSALKICDSMLSAELENLKHLELVVVS